MDPVVVGTVVFVCTLGGALAGSWLSRALPAHHLDGDSRNTVQVGIGLVATMTALVLGLVTASAKSSFDAADAVVKHVASEAITLDRLLARYGPETGEIRVGLHRMLAEKADQIWRQGSRVSELEPSLAGVEGLADAIRRLTPRDDAQRSLQNRAAELGEELLQTRWVVFTGDGPSVPPVFLAILLFWLTITFASFGLFAPQNATVLGVLLVCALSVASAVFLILELDGPFDGLLVVSPEPMRFALAHLAR